MYAAPCAFLFDDVNRKHSPSQTDRPHITAATREIAVVDFGDEGTEIKTFEFNHFFPSDAPQGI